MIPILAGAAAAALVVLRCPRCGTVQARARTAAGTAYRCRACHGEITPPARRETSR